MNIDIKKEIDNSSFFYETKTIYYVSLDMTVLRFVFI